MTHTDEERLDFDPFAGDEAELSLRTVRIRTARKEHPCYALPERRDGHTIKPGERYRHERARVDGEFWGDYRLCLACCDQWLDEINGPDNEDDQQ